MSTIVCKFGGSSVSDAGMFQRVLSIVQSDASRRYIVLSAPGKRFERDEKITDLFYRAHRDAMLGNNSILAKIFKRYAQIRDVLAPDFDLEAEFCDIRAKLKFSCDYAASRGEYLCARLFCAYANLPFVDAKELIYFLPNGEVDYARSKNAIQSRLSPLPRAVIPGFYGTNASGEIQTFSRGGSDVSGAVLSALLEADLYENWTDVDGLYTADPNIVSDVQRNHHVSFSQMESIARAGAQLLHPDALSPLKGKGIDVLLKNTFLPENEGTRIHEKWNHDVKCVTGRRTAQIENTRQEIISFDSHIFSEINVFGCEPAQLCAIVKAVNPIHIIHMQDHMRLIVPCEEYEAGIRAIHAILMKRENPDALL